MRKFIVIGLFACFTALLVLPLAGCGKPKDEPLKKGGTAPSTSSGISGHNKAIDDAGNP